MPVFETPEPISVTLELQVGNVRISASDRADTTVDVRPSDPSDASDVEAAEQVRVDHSNGALRITGPKARIFDFSRKSRSVEVAIELPSGSPLSGELQVGDLGSTGRLGECRFKVAAGNVRLERTGPLRVETSAGHVTADVVAGSAEVQTGSGSVRIDDVEGAVIIKNSNGGTAIGTATGDVRVRSANGDISVDRAGAGVDAKTANGNVRIGQVARGVVELATSMGDVEIGIAKGTAARLDAHTGFGQVHNQLDSTTGPDESDETVEVHARTSFGSITVRRG